MSFTLQKFVTELSTRDRDLLLAFRAPDGATGPGYHVTELRHARIDGIDCGGNLNHWTEAALELLDATTGRPMTLAKFTGIARASMDKVPGLATSPLHVEFSPENKGLSRYQIGAISQDGARLVVGLTPGSAQCKPAARAGTDFCGPAKSETVSCCGTPARASACC